MKTMSADMIAPSRTAIVSTAVLPTNFSTRDVDQEQRVACRVLQRVLQRVLADLDDAHDRSTGKKHAEP